MKKIMAIILTSIFLIVPVLARQSPCAHLPAPARRRWAQVAGQVQAEQDMTAQLKVRFAPLHIYLDSSNKLLAAYQFELKVAAGKPAPAKAGVKIVGVEGGQHKAFKEAPYYDPAALANDRIIIAAFNTGRELPKGRTRIATIHLQIIGDAEPDYELKLTVAADADAKEIPAKISFACTCPAQVGTGEKGE